MLQSFSTQPFSQHFYLSSIYENYEILCQIANAKLLSHTRHWTWDGWKKVFSLNKFMRQLDEHVYVCVCGIFLIKHIYPIFLKIPSSHLRNNFCAPLLFRYYIWSTKILQTIKLNDDRKHEAGNKKRFFSSACTFH